MKKEKDWLYKKFLLRNVLANKMNDEVKIRISDYVNWMYLFIKRMLLENHSLFQVFKFESKNISLQWH